VEELPRPGYPRNGSSLAPIRFSKLLALAFAVRDRWRAQAHQQGTGRIDFQMVAENPTWGAPRIHGELLKLGFDVSERTVSRWVGRAPKMPDASRRWKTFLSNHPEVIAAMDFFTVPTLAFSVLYCFFLIAHDRRH
jgi:putative transposase